MKRPARNHSMYAKLEHDLRSGILNGLYPADQFLPSEAELCKRYQVSRNTVRKGLQRLCDQNYIRKENGVGSLVISLQERQQFKRQLGKLLVVTPGDSGETRNPFDHNVILGVEAYARKHGCTVYYESNQATARKLLSDYHNFLYDGIIWSRANSDDFGKVDFLHIQHVPQVMIARHFQGIPSVFYDIRQALQQVISLLQLLGHRDLLLIDKNNDRSFIQERQSEFLQQCRAFDCCGYVSRLPEDSGQRDFHHLEQHIRNCSACICLGQWVEELQLFLHDQGMAIPRDLSLLAFDLYEAGEKPEYTRVVQPVMAMGECAAGLLFAHDQYTKTPPPQKMVPGFLLIGSNASHGLAAVQVSRKISCSIPLDAGNKICANKRQKSSRGISSEESLKTIEARRII